MKKLAIVLAATALLASAANAGTLQLYFALGPPTASAGVYVDPVVGTVNSPTGGNLYSSTRVLNGAAVGNPTLAGAGRLYVWATGNDSGVDADGDGIIDASVWNGIAFNIDVTGTVSLTGGGMLNIRKNSGVPIYRRWESSADFTNPTYNLVAITAGGISFQAAGDGYDDTNNTAGTLGYKVLLGFVDVAPGASGGSLFFAAGGAGFNGGGNPQGTTGVIFFGSGDAGLANNAAAGTRSAVADATILPEPASLVLLALAGLAIRRR